MFLLFLFSCTVQKEKPVIPTSEKLPEIKKPPLVEWQDKWNKIFHESKKEGRVVVCTSAGADTRTALTRAFKNKFGIDLDFVSGKSAQLAEKII